MSNLKQYIITPNYVTATKSNYERVWRDVGSLFIIHRYYNNINDLLSQHTGTDITLYKD